jgi:hypothetical protein
VPRVLGEKSVFQARTSGALLAHRSEPEPETRDKPGLIGFAARVADEIGGRAERF